MDTIQTEGEQTKRLLLQEHENYTTESVKQSANANLRLDKLCGTFVLLALILAFTGYVYIVYLRGQFSYLVLLSYLVIH